MATSYRATTDIGVEGISDGGAPPTPTDLLKTNDWPSAYDASGVSTSSSDDFANPLAIGRRYNVVFFPDLTSTAHIPFVEVYARRGSSAGPAVNIKVWRKAGGWVVATEDPSSTGTLLASTTVSVSGSAVLHTLALGGTYDLKELCVEFIASSGGSTPVVNIHDVLFSGARVRGLLVL